jgi:hypothetical protein
MMAFDEHPPWRFRNNPRNAKISDVVSSKNSV